MLQQIVMRTKYVIIGRKNLGKSPIFTLELSQKSDFQPSTTKPDNIGHPTVKIGQKFDPWGGFEGGFSFCEN